MAPGLNARLLVRKIIIRLLRQIQLKELCMNRLSHVWILKCFIGFSSAFVLFSACGGTSPQPESATAAVADRTAPEHWTTGLGLVEANNLAGALAELEAAVRKDAQVRYRIGVAHVRFLMGDVDAALKAYREIAAAADVAGDAKAAFEKEIARIEKKEKLDGPSMAGQWKRSEPALVSAEAAVAAGDWVTAYTDYDKAYQYNQDFTLLMESAMAASRAGEWPWAYKKYREYAARVATGFLLT